jgi:hypothetical protein
MASTTLVQTLRMSPMLLTALELQFAHWQLWDQHCEKCAKTKFESPEIVRPLFDLHRRCRSREW